MNFVNIFDLNQNNVVLNTNDPLLDLVFSKHTISIHKVTDDAGDYHNSPLVVDIVNIVASFVTSSNAEAHNFKRADFRSPYLSLVKADWTVLSYESDIDTAVQLYSQLDLYVSKKKCNKKYPVCYGGHLIDDI